jgi:hypothetical protein
MKDASNCNYFIRMLGSVKMIRMIGASTAEIDDADAAVSEILAQLRTNGALLDNSAQVKKSVPYTAGADRQ